MAVQSNSDTLITVFGGSGFLGRHLVRALARRRFRIRVAVRRPELAGHLQPLGGVGQIHAVQANLRYPRSVEAAVRDAHIVVNLVGILFERGRQRFEVVQHKGAEHVALAAQAAGARLLHVSAIGADENARALYAQSKAKGEAAVRAVMPEATIIRPSILFGPDDDFFNRFGSLAAMLPVLPLIGGGHTRMQPVFAGDVAEAIATLIEQQAGQGKTYEFGGPDVRTFRELMEFVLATTERNCALVPLPFWMAKLQAALLQFLPRPPLTPDQVDLLRSDNVVSDEAIAEKRTLAGLGFTPTSYETITPGYLWRFRKTGQFRTGRLA
jgi:NADH dehydrogenase